MDSREIRAMMAELAPVVRECVGVAVTPLLARIDTLERSLASLPTPRDGKDADPVTILRLVEETVAKLPPPKDGRDADPEVVAELVAKAVAALPEAKDGLPGQPGKDADPVTILRLVEETVAKLPPPKDGRDADPEVVAELVAKAVAALPEAKDGLPGQPGKDADPEAIIALVDDVVSRAVGDLPVPKDGKDADLGLVQRMVAEEVSKLPQPRDGKDVDQEAVVALVDDVVSRAVTALPRPQDGKSVTVEELRPLVEEAVSRAAAAIPVPKDGVGMAGALIDRAGHLAVTMTDGTMRDLGPVVGKDADQAALERMIAEKCAAIPVPKDGKDGRDGLGFDDLQVTHDGDRGFSFRLERGGVIKEFAFSVPAMIYRGVFREGHAYVKGDTVTWAGSLWHCDQDTSDKPDDGSRLWTLSAKRGRDGKDTVTFAPPPAPVKLPPQNGAAK